MSAIHALRIGGAGPFLRDDVSNHALQVGPGTGGIVLRAQGDVAAGPVYVATVGWTEAPGCTLTNLGNPLPSGFYYDVEWSIPIINEGAVSQVQAEMCLTEDNGATWLDLVGWTFMFPLSHEAGGVYNLGRVNVDRRTTTLPINGFRLRLGNAVHPDVAWYARSTRLHVTQWVGPMP